MIRRRLENLLLTLIVIALIGCGALGPRALAMSITQPGGTALQGNPICTGGVTKNAALIWNGTQWCGNTAPQFTTLNVANASGASDYMQTQGDASPGIVFDLGFSSNTFNSLQYVVGTGLEIGNGTVAPTLVINESQQWKGAAIATSNGGTGLTAYPAPTLNGCNPSSDTSIVANTPTTICSGSTGTLPAAPDGTWLIYSTGLAYIVLGASAGNCAEKVTAGSFTAVADFGPAAASTGDTLSTLLITTPGSNASISFSLIVECTVAATVKKNDTIFSATASGASILILPQ